jgi:hypothetical protein
MASRIDTPDDVEDYLDVDKEIPNQKWVCISFLSPEKILKKKDQYFFSEFMKYFDFRFKSELIEKFLGEANLERKRDWDTFEKTITDKIDEINLAKKEGKPFDEINPADVVSEMKTRFLCLEKNMSDWEKFLKENRPEFIDKTIEDAYTDFMFQHKKTLEEKFHEANDFQTTVRGVKIRGVYPSQKEADIRSKVLQKLDKRHNIFIGQVGYWLPWDPEAHEVGKQEYAEKELNDLMGKYHENELKKEEYYELQKQEKLKESLKAKAQKKSAGLDGASSASSPADIAASADSRPDSSLFTDSMSDYRRRFAEADSKTAAPEDDA